LLAVEVVVLLVVAVVSIQGFLLSLCGYRTDLGLDRGNTEHPIQPHSALGCPVADSSGTIRPFVPARALAAGHATVAAHSLAALVVDLEAVQDMIVDLYRIVEAVGLLLMEVH
jgi:hypothetical protein